MSGTKILMVSESNNRTGDALPTAQSGIDINKALKNGEPIIIGVDYKVVDYNDKLEDHFIVIVGRTVTEDSKGDQIVQYHYYDPQTSQSAHGTSTNNILTLTSGNKLTGTYTTISEKSQNYTATSVRPNK